MEKYYKPKGCPVHGTTQLNDNDVKVPKIGIDQKKFNEIAQKITDKTLISEDLFKYTNDFLQKGINQVWGDIKYDDSNFVFVQRLKRNASRFAGYKTAAQTKQIFKAKPDEYPAINNSYNNNWLRTEYVHTVRSNRSAQNWQKYQADKDIYPFLEYMPSSSAEPRTEHQRLVGVIKDIDDSFWNTWLPPSDWGCKCSVQQRRSNKGANPVPDDILLPPKNMRNNPGKTAQIFTDDHPMIKAVSKSRAVQIDKQYQYLERKFLRKSTFNYAIENILNKKFYLDANEIEFTKKGIEKVINQPHEFYVEKMDLINQLEDVFNNATFVDKILPSENRIATIAFTHIYKVDFMNKNSYLILWEYRSGEFVLHSIVDKIKK